MSRYFCLLLLTLAACRKEPALKQLPDLTQDYILPQGKSPADARIVALYNKYNAYFLYDFKDADFWWYFEYKAQDSKATYSYTSSNPQSADLILDFMDEAFFRFYNEDFVKNKIRLYKVMLVDSLKLGSQQIYARAVTFPGGSVQLALGHVAPRFGSYNGAVKTLYKNALHRAIWQIIGASFANEIPPAFKALTDYTKVATYFDPGSPDYYLRRGFYTQYSLSLSTLTPEADFISFIQQMARFTPAQLQADWTSYPLLKQKYDIVKNFLIAKYGVDLEAIFAYTFM